MPILYPLSQSETKTVTAEKKPSGWDPLKLTDEAGADVAGKTAYIGAKITAHSVLYDASVAYKPGLANKTVRLMRQLGVGGWTKVADVTTNPYGEAVYTYTLVDAGTNNFRYEWDGDATYTGCVKLGFVQVQMRR